MKRISTILLFTVLSYLSFGQQGQKVDWFYITGSLSVGTGGVIKADASSWFQAGNDTTTRGALLPRVINLDSLVAKNVNNKRGVFAYYIPDSVLYHLDGTSKVRYMTYKDSAYIRSLLPDTAYTAGWGILKTGHEFRADSTLLGSKTFIANTYVPLTRTITATAPLTITNSGVLSANLTIALAGLSGLGSANTVLGMNAAGTAYEYKAFAIGATGTTPAWVHTTNTITLNIPLMAATLVTSGLLSSSTQSIPGIKIFTGNVSLGHSASPLYPADLVDGYMRGKVRLRTDNTTSQPILRVERNDLNVMWELQNVNSNTDLVLNSSSRSNVIYFDRTATVPAVYFGMTNALTDNANATGRSHVFANASSGTSTYGISNVCDMGAIFHDIGNGSVRGGGIELWGRNVTNSTSTPGVRIRTLYNSAFDRTYDLQISVNANTNVQSGYQGLTEVLRIKYNGNLGLGVTNPLAVLHIKAGTATNAQIRLDPSTLLSTALAGSLEYNNSLYGTKNSGLRYGIGGIIFNAQADVGNATTVETDLHSYTTPANTFEINGGNVEAEYSVSLANNANTKTIKVYFAGTAIYTSAAITTSGVVGYTNVRTTLSRVSSTVVRYTVAILGGGCSLVSDVVSGELTGLTLTGTNILKITGTGTATNDLVLSKVFGKWYPVANN